MKDLWFCVGKQSLNVQIQSAMGKCPNGLAIPGVADCNGRVTNRYKFAKMIPFLANECYHIHLHDSTLPQNSVVFLFFFVPLKILQYHL